MAAGIDLTLNTLSQAGSAGSLFGGSAMQDAAKTANENRSMQKFQNLLESLKKNEANNSSSSVSLPAAQPEIDKSSQLYEKSLELETFFVKIMLSSMRNTVTKTDLSGGNSYAQKMYEDMLYDELAGVMTKNADFGLAAQMYRQLVNVDA